MKFGKLVASELRLWLIVIVSSIIIIGFGILIFSPLFDVKQIQVRRDDARLDSEEIQRTLAPLFHHRLFLVTRKQVETLLMAAFNDIDEVDVSKDYPSTLVVGLTLDPLIAKLEIAGEEQVQLGSGAVMVAEPVVSHAYLTARGYVVLSAVVLEKNEELPQIKILDWGIRPEHRSFLLEPDFIEIFFDAREQMEQFFGSPVTAATIYVRGNEFHLQAQGKSFWFDATAPVDEQIERLRGFLKVTSLEQVKFYVDLRLTDKVVYQ